MLSAYHCRHIRLNSRPVARYAAAQRYCGRMAAYSPKLRCVASQRLHTLLQILRNDSAVWASSVASRDKAAGTAAM